MVHHQESDTHMPVQMARSIYLQGLVELESPISICEADKCPGHRLKLQGFPRLRQEACRRLSDY